jgi:hypothetical protein
MTPEEEWLASAVNRVMAEFRAEMGEAVAADAKADPALEQALGEAIRAATDDPGLNLADEILRRLAELRAEAGTRGPITEKQRGAWQRAVSTVKNSDFWLHG